MGRFKKNVALALTFSVTMLAAVSALVDKAPAYTYVDNEQSYSCNGVTIYWNSSLVYMMSGLE